MELEPRIQFLPRRIGKPGEVLDIAASQFPYGKNLRMFGKHCAVHFVHKLMHTGSVDKWFALSRHRIREILRLGDLVDDIKAESLDSLLQPESQNIIQFLPHLRIFPIQIGLADRIQMKIILVQRRDKLPCRTAKTALPVVRCTAIRRRITENIVILVFFVSGQRLLEPDVLAGCMIEYHVHHDPQPQSIRFGHQPFQVPHGTEHRFNIPVVRHIIPIVILRRAKERRDPHMGRPQPADVRQPLPHPLQVSHTVTIGIPERFDINLIDRSFAMYVSHT